MARWLITGCSTGIGREIACAALEAGNAVVVTARRVESVTDLADEYGDRAVTVALDVTDKEQIAAAVRTATDAFGGIDVLVNNAGNGYLAAIEEGEDDQVRKLFDVNYFSPPTTTTLPHSLPWIVVGCKGARGESVPPPLPPRRGAPPWGGRSANADACAFSWRAVFGPCFGAERAVLAFCLFGSVALARQLEDRRVMDESIDGSGGGHGVFEDPIPLREDQV